MYQKLLLFLLSTKWSNLWDGSWLNCIKPGAVPSVEPCENVVHHSRQGEDWIWRGQHSHPPLAWHSGETVGRDMGADISRSGPYLQHQEVSSTAAGWATHRHRWDSFTDMLRAVRELNCSSHLIKPKGTAIWSFFNFDNIKIIRLKSYISDNSWHTFCLLGDFFEAWEVLLNHIQSAALSKNNEVSLAALKSFQEILQIVTPVKDSDKVGDALAAMGVPPVLIDPLSASGPGRPLVRSDSLVERLTRYNGAELQNPPPGEESALEDSALWWSAWNTWYRTGTDCTRPPSGPTEKFSFIPSQPFLTALIQIFPALYQHIKAKFSMDELKKLGVILHGAVSVPISSDASPFILPSYTEAVLTSLQEAVLTALDVLQKVSQ